ncbi:hypothetical protein [Cellulomonas chitinilytica]|nr:hypothetical protein [Cellulomonas chitinilytica]
MTLIVDHLRGLAATTAAPQVTFSNWSLVRPTLEGLATVFWLYDPAIDRHERVRRRFGLRLVSLTEQMSMVRPLDKVAADEIAGRMLEIKSTAQVLGMAYRQRKFADGRIAASLDSPVPSSQRLIDDLIAASTTTRGYGPFIHRMTSSVSHMQTHAVHPFVAETQDGSEPGLASVRVGLSFGTYSAVVGSVVLGTQHTMLRLCEYYGWSRTPWDREARPAMAQWLRWFQQFGDAR